jgi:hypothetical protein
MLLSRRAAGLLLLLLVPVILGGLTTSGCKAGFPVTVEPDPRVFTLFAGLLAAGYSDRDGTSLNPTQQAVWDALEELDPAIRAGFASLLANQTGEAAPEFGLTGRVLDAGPPPEFKGLESTPMQVYLQHLWANHAQALYKDTREAHTAMAQSLASAKDTVQQVLAYARVKTVPFDSLRVVPNPLACPGFSYRYLPYSRLDPAYIVLGPDDGDLTRTLAREAFRLCLDIEVLRDLLYAAGVFDSLNKVFEMSRAYPFGQDRCGDLSDFVEENLARACALRAFPPPAAETATALADEWDAGFVLVEDFYNALADYESGPRNLADSLGELVLALEGAAIADRMADASQPAEEPVEVSQAPIPDPTAEQPWVCNYANEDPHSEGTPGPFPASWKMGTHRLEVGSDWYLFTILKGRTRDLNIFGFLQMMTGAVVVVVTLPTVRWEGPAPWKIGDKPVCGGRFIAPEGGD